MKNLFLNCFMLLAFTGISQTVLYDFETPETSTNFQIFGGNLEGVITENIANPDPSGINTSATVVEGKKASDAPVWGGMFTNPSPVGLIDATNGGQVCFDVWSSEIAVFSLKLETTAFDAPENYRQELSNTTAGQWETLCFDLSLNSLDGALLSGSGRVYNNLVIFPNWDVEGNGTEAIYYFDNFIVPESAPQVLCTTIFDFETAESSGEGTIFSGSLDGTVTTVEANPNPTGINTSGNVMHYIKAGDAMTWGGAAIVLDNPINASSVNQICVDYHSAVAGNLTLKLELEAFDDPENWIQTKANTTPGAWQTLCFDLTIPSFEGNMTSAVGKTYPKIIIFPEFGIAGTGSDQDFFLDNFIAKIDNSVKTYQVTFNLDMNTYGDVFGSPYVSGTFNNWSGDGNPLTDADGDGIYTTTVTIEQGTIEYLFTIDNWTVQEKFDGSEACTTPISAEFKNRRMVVTADADLATVCWQSCYACGNSAKITWNLNMNNEVVSPDGVFIAGGASFGHGDYPMTDDDGDGVYSITIERELGFSSHYTFINGICLPDWSCKEDIAGQDCADPDNFNDRFLDPIAGDTEFNTCFAQCTTDGSCEGAQAYNVTFRVDMSQVTAAANVYVAGATINNWDPTTTELLDGNGNSIYEVTVQLFPGLHEYKFVNGTEWEELTQGDDCTITDPSGMFTNRLLILGEADLVVDAYLFGTCDVATSVNDLILDNSIAQVAPTVTNDEFYISVNEMHATMSYTVFDITGKTLIQDVINNPRQSVSVAELNAGLYLVKVQVGNKFLNAKIIKN